MAVLDFVLLFASGAVFATGTFAVAAEPMAAFERVAAAFERVVRVLVVSTSSSSSLSVSAQDFSFPLPEEPLLFFLRSRESSSLFTGATFPPRFTSHFCLSSASTAKAASENWNATRNSLCLASQKS